MCFCINIQVWGYGFASDEVFCAPLLGVFVVFLIVFSFFSCLSVELGDGFQGDCNRVGRRSFLFRLTVICPVGMGIRFCRGGLVRSVLCHCSHKQPMKILLCLPGSRDVAGWGCLAGRLWPGLCARWRLSAALFRWMPDRFPFFSPGRSFCWVSVVSLPFSAFLARSSLPDSCFSCLRSTGGCSVLSQSSRLPP